MDYHQRSYPDFGDSNFAQEPRSPSSQNLYLPTQESCEKDFSSAMVILFLKKSRDDVSFRRFEFRAKILGFLGILFFNSEYKILQKK